MNSRTFLAGISDAAGGSILALLFGSGQIGACLGPLGVTPVRCAAAGGALPTVGAAVPMLLAALCLGILVVMRPRRALVGATGATIGGVLGVAFYLALRPTVLEGPDFDGTPLSFPLPIESDVLIWSLVGGAMAGLVIAAALSQFTSWTRRQRGTI